MHKDTLNHLTDVTSDCLLEQLKKKLPSLYFVEGLDDVQENRYRWQPLELSRFQYHASGKE